MQRTSRRIAVGILAASTLLAATAVHAIPRTYLAENGNDANPCTSALPCRNIPAALAAVDPNGEIWMLDSATYNTGTVTINKSVTIQAMPGIVGNILATGGDGMIINAPSIRVQLRNLQFVNSSGTNNGLTFLNGASLTVRDITSSGMILAGIFVTAPNSRTQIYNSTFVANTIGIRVANGKVTVESSYIQNNAIGVEGVGNGGTSNTSAGSTNNPPNGTVVVRVSNSQIIDNNNAFHMESPGFRQSGACNGWNIFLRSTGSGSTNHIVGNATYVNTTGTADYNAGCSAGQFDIGGYQSPT